MLISGFENPVFKLHQVKVENQHILGNAHRETLQPFYSAFGDKHRRVPVAQVLHWISSNAKQVAMLFSPLGVCPTKRTDAYRKP